MWGIFEPFIKTFIPIFVAVDAIGNIPLFISLVNGVSRKHRHRVIIESVTTATVIAILFMFAGKWVLRFIGISVPDFQIAGGLLLFIISIYLLLPGISKGMFAVNHNKDVGVFPLGTPLITGPAVLTTILIVLDEFGVWLTFLSLAINMLFVWFTLVKADFIMKLLGASGTRAFSKIMYILLAAIGVMMVRRGIMNLIGGALAG